MILETVLVWAAAIILAVILSPFIFILSVLLVMLGLFLFLVSLFAVFFVGAITIQIIAWPFRRLAKLFTKKRI